MKKLLACLGAALFAILPGGGTAALPRHNPEMKALRKQHKEQRKALKEQQRAVKRVMAQHELPPESQQRLRDNLKMQRQQLHRSQRDETRRLKAKNKSLEQARSAN